MNRSTPKGPTTISKHRREQAQKDFASYGTPELVAPAADLKKLPLAAGTHGHGTHCPGSIAFGLLGGGVWRPYSTGLSGT